MTAKIRAILCDMDGVLVDSEVLHWESVHDVLRAHKALGSQERLIPRIGWGDHALWEELKALYGLQATAIDLTEQRAKFAENRLKQTPPPLIKGSLEGLTNLKSQQTDLKIAVVSASPLQQMILSLKPYPKIFDLLISGVDHCLHNKPSPEPYLTAMKQLQVQPQECVIIEDSPTGLEAAILSGARVWCLGKAPGSERFEAQLQGYLLGIDELILSSQD